MSPAAESLPSAKEILPAGGRPLIMGIVNVTPDSFYAASRKGSTEDAVGRAMELAEEGADILDIGGQSTRPGSDPVSAEDELRRVIPVVEALADKCRASVSVDTDKARVARLALEAGAAIVNDVSALRSDPAMAEVCRDAKAVILMHRGGVDPKTMQKTPSYRDVVAEVKTFLSERMNAFVKAGGDAARVWVDPGIGFGKDLGHNLSLLKHIDEFAGLAPVVLGVSRKSFLGRVMAPGAAAFPGPEERLEGSLAAAAWACLRGVRVIRVHDVKETGRVLQALSAIREAA